MEESGWTLAQRRLGERYRNRFCQDGQDSVDQRETNFMAVRALDFLVCGAVNERHLPADDSLSYHFFCVRCNRRTLATRKHQKPDQSHT